jgi:hypothetical protein
MRLEEVVVVDEVLVVEVRNVVVVRGEVVCEVVVGEWLWLKKLFLELW